jgi:hypothetical protein
MTHTFYDAQLTRRCELINRIMDYLKAEGIAVKDLTKEQYEVFSKMFHEEQKNTQRNYLNWIQWWGSYIHGEHEEKLQKEWEECPHMACKSIQATIKELKSDVA